MTEKQKREIENKRVATNCHELINSSVDSRMRPYVVAMAEEHEQTRKEVKDLKGVVLELKGGKINDIIQYVMIAGIILSMILLRGC